MSIVLLNLNWISFSAKNGGNKFAVTLRLPLSERGHYYIPKRWLDRQIQFNLLVHRQAKKKKNTIENILCDSYCTAVIFTADRKKHQQKNISTRNYC